MIEDSYRLTVRLLVTGTGTWTTKLLWLATSVVGNEQGTVVRDESLLQLVLAVLIDVLLVVGNLHFCVSSLMLHVCYGECYFSRSILWMRRPSAYLRRLGGTYDALGNSLTDRVDLRSVTTSTDADADVDVGCNNALLAHAPQVPYADDRRVSSFPPPPLAGAMSFLHNCSHALPNVHTLFLCAIPTPVAYALIHHVPNLSRPRMRRGS